MEITATDVASGAALSHDDLLELSESDGNCLCFGISFSAASVVVAMTEDLPVIWEQESSSKFHRQFGYHEIHRVEGVSAIGFVKLPIDQSITTSVEVSLIRCLISGFSTDLLNNDTVLFFQIGSELPGAIYQTVKSAMKMGSDNFFWRYNTSSLNDSYLGIAQDRICRHLIQSHNYHCQKYGFLELFRAAETCFYASILQNINARFMSSPERTVKEALDSIKAESKAIKSVIDANQSNAHADLIADTINQLRGSGNSFAVALYAAFEKRTDRDSNKTWRASCYIFSIRCSIAHAGKDGLVYEDFNDADSLIGGIYSLFEEIITSAVGLSPINN